MKLIGIRAALAAAALATMSLSSQAQAQAQAQPKSPAEALGAHFRTIDSHGVKLRVAEAGKGPLVILVHGWPEWEEQTLDAPILNARDVQAFDIWVKQIVHPQGAECRTAFRTLQRFERDGARFALVEAKPETGRMHQIRVHLHHLGLPIVGDKLYGHDDRCYLEFIETGWTEALEQRLILPRQALHSSRLELNLEGFPPCWEAPLPPEFAL